MKKLLMVSVEASTEAIANDMIESLARAACDVANSTEDDGPDGENGAHILIEDLPDYSPEWRGDEHEEFTIGDWRDEVFRGDTKLSYRQWVAHNIEIDY